MNELRLPASRLVAALAISAALLCVALPRSARSATPLEMARAVRLQGCRGHSGTYAPLRLIGGLSDAALDVSHGTTLKTAVARTGYREQESTLLHVSGDSAALQRALAGPLCGTVADSHFSDVGIAQRGRDTWIVFAIPFATPSPASAAEVDSELLRRINLARSQPRRCGARWFSAAAPLQNDPLLRAAAEAHAKDMLDHHYFAHEGRDGSTPAQRLRSAGYRYRLVGENIASGPTTAQEAVDGWLASPGHCENLMDPRFTQSGVAHAANSYGPPRIYWVQEFAAPP